MKQINLLPKPTFIEKYKKLFGIAGAFVLLVIVGLYLFKSSDIPSTSSLPSSSAPTSISKYSIDKIKVIGYLCKSSQAASNQCWCVIKTPDGEISTLKVGDSVGYEKAQVADINPTGIYLNVPQKKDLIFIPSKKD